MEDVRQSALAVGDAEQARVDPVLLGELAEGTNEPMPGPERVPPLEPADPFVPGLLVVLQGVQHRSVDAEHGGGAVVDDGQLELIV